MASSRPEYREVACQQMSVICMAAMLAAAASLAGCGCGDLSIVGDADGQDEHGSDSTDTADAPDALGEPDMPVPCNRDEDCDDGAECNGSETCSAAGYCEPGVPMNCDDGNPCTIDGCDPVADACASVPLDADGDGYMAERGPGGEACGDDCDDSRAEAHPGAWELCNLLDDDCDSLVDETDILLPPTQITDGENSNNIADVEWAGDRFALTWTQSWSVGETSRRALVLRMVSPEGVVTGIEGRTELVGGWSGASIAWTGSGVVVAFNDAIPMNSSVFTRRFDMEGTPVGDPVRISDGPLQSMTPDITWSGSEFGSAWTDDRDGNSEIYFARLDAEGERIGPEVRVSNASGSSSGQRISWTGSDYAIIWTDMRDMWVSEGGVYLTHMSADGHETADEACVMEASSDHFVQQVAATGDGFAWTVRHGYHEDVPGDPFGEQHVDTRLHGANMSGVPSESVQISSIAYVPSSFFYEETEDFVLSWKDDELGVFTWHARGTFDDSNWTLSFQRLETDGEWMGSEVPLVESETYPTVGGRDMAWSGSTFGLAWSKQPEGTADTYQQVYFAIVAPCL